MHAGPVNFASRAHCEIPWFSRALLTDAYHVGTRGRLIATDCQTDLLSFWVDVESYRGAAHPANVCSQPTSFGVPAATSHQQPGAVAYTTAPDSKAAFDADQLGAGAACIVARYFGADAEFEVPFPPHIRAEVIRKEKEASGSPTPDLFDAAQQYIFRLLEVEVFPRFRESALSSDADPGEDLLVTRAGRCAA